VLFSIILLTTYLLSCSSDEDAEFPKITVERPAAGTIYENGDTIKFKAIYSDNTQIVSVSLQLVDKDNKPALGAISAVPVSNPFTFEGEYIINDPLLPGGVYNLRFQTSDGMNTTNHFIEVQIHELDRELLYPIIVTHPAASSWEAYLLLPNETWKKFSTHSGDYCGSDVFPAASQFYICGKYQSNLEAVKLSEGNQVWSVKPGFNQSQRWFEGIVFDQQYVYIACYEGNIRGYEKTGNEKYKSETFPNEYPKLSALTNNFIIGSFVDDYSINKHLVVFHNQGGKMIYNKFIQKNIVGLLHTSGDKALVFSNNNKVGDISLYNGSDNSLAPLHTITEGSIHEAAEMNSDNYIISTSAGIFRYQLSKNSLTAFAANTANSEIACDPVSQVVYVSSDQRIDMYTFPYAELAGSFTTPGSVVDLHLMFNK